jgi:hypothetical protein
MKFTLKELCKSGSYNPDYNKLEPWQKRNGEDLVRKVNNLGYEEPMKASSFARDIEKQKQINPKAMNSAHLYFAAVDIADPDHKLQDWLNTIDGQRALVENGLWVEDFSATPTWVHIQLYSVNSGNRFFRP